MPWYNPVSWYLDSDNIAAGAAADAGNAQITNSLASQGLMTQADAAAANAHYAAGAADSTIEGATAQVNDAFIEGAREGLAAELNFFTNILPDGINKTLSTILKAIFKAIPWWAWIIGAAALFVWMGGLALLQGSLKRFAK